jgi:hypothetical protein
VTEVDESTLEGVLKSLLDYMPNAPARLRELIIANMSNLFARDANMAAVETDVRRERLRPDLTPVESAAPAIKYAAELSTRCCPRGIRFGIYEAHRSEALASWTPFDPFEETR